MNSHDPKRIKFTPARQFWRAFSYVMQAHENHYTKRAGVAGVRARATPFITQKIYPRKFLWQDTSVNARRS